MSLFLIYLLLKDSSTFLLKMPTDLMIKSLDWPENLECTFENCLSKACSEALAYLYILLVSNFRAPLERKNNLIVLLIKYWACLSCLDSFGEHLVQYSTVIPHITSIMTFVKKLYWSIDGSDLNLKAKRIEFPEKFRRFSALLSCDKFSCLWWLLMLWGRSFCFTIRIILYWIRITWLPWVL